MMKTDTMIVEVSEAMAARIHAAVASGDYATPSDLVEDALRQWSDERNVQEPSVERLRQAWDAGKAGGVHGRLDFDDLRQEARRRLAAVRTTPHRAD